MRHLSLFGVPHNDGPVASDNWTTKRGTEELARRIEAYWAERGYMVCCRVVEKGFHPVLRSVRWEIHSDLIDGLPRYSNLPAQNAEAA